MTDTYLTLPCSAPPPAAGRPADVVIHDEDLAGRIKALVARRIAEQPQAVHGVQLPSGQMQKVLLSTNDRAIKLSLGPDLLGIAFIANDEEPAYRIRVQGGCVTLRGGLQTEDLEDRLRCIAEYPVSSYDKVPYGYVNPEGLVTAILCMGESRTEEGLNGNFYLYQWPDSYVLEGQTLPHELLFRRGVPDGDGWFRRFWEMVDDGRLVRLSDRFRNYPSEIWAVGDGSGLNWVEIGESDGKSPTVSAGRYPFWHITEAERGDRYPELWKGEAYRNKLRRWFK